mgnify:CR=1 FL=1
MKPLLALLLFVLPQITFAQSKADQSVLDAEQRRFEAMTRKDTAALRDMLADDLVYIHSNALTENKKEHLSSIASGRMVYETMTREQARVRRYGKTALTNGIVNVKGTVKGTTFELRLAYTAVYRKKGGKWLLANWQSTKLP